VAIARAMVRNPKILIADEPTGNLDSHNSAEVIALLEKINAHGTTVLLVTHDTNIVNTLNKRTITLEKGRVTSDTAGGVKNV
jgi:cell division transport system ATP-binding protein